MRDNIQGVNVYLCQIWSLLVLINFQNFLIRAIHCLNRGSNQPNKKKLKKIIPRVQSRRFEHLKRSTTASNKILLQYTTGKQTNKQKSKQKDGIFFFDDIKMTALIRRRFALDLFTRNLVVKKVCRVSDLFQCKFWPFAYNFRSKTGGLLNNADAKIASAANLSQAIYLLIKRHRQLLH